MTGQVPDTLFYENSSYSIVGLKGEGLPSPFDFGFRPVSPNTANWRGFIMTFKIVGELLNLHEMNVTLEDTKEKPLIINEVKPKVEKDGLIHFTYINLKLRTHFTGNMLIAKNFIDSMYIHMGFQSPISFETVIELEFKEGSLVKVRNLSMLMKKWRDKDMSDGKLKHPHNVQAWIARTFSLDYDF